jgi:hypothetical protein
MIDSARSRDYEVAVPEPLDGGSAGTTGTVQTNRSAVDRATMWRTAG